MEPRIQYAKTEDGVSIAYWTLGEGTPLLATPNSALTWSLRTWQIPEARAYSEKLARDRLLVRYDHRGVGHSEHDISEQSFETLVSDLEAVADQAGLETFALYACYTCAPYAIAYAVRHPERISKLILMHASARAADFFNLDRLQKARESADEDPEFYLQVMVREVFGWAEGERAELWISDMLKEVDPRVFQMTLDTIIETDVTELLPQVAAPTLVLHRRDVRRPSLAAARVLAGGIPGAQLVVLDGDSAPPYLGDVDAVVSAIDEFLADGVEAKPRATPATREGPAPGGLVTILFTDMESSTALTERLGDAGAQEVRRAHNEIVRAALASNSGSEIKHTGDGIMASFPTASSALDCAIAIQRGVAAHKEERPDSPLAVYIGLNAGEPIAEDGDLFGTSVDLAARLVDHAQPGQILAADVVRQLAAGKQFLFSDLGETELRGFEDPVKLWELRWQPAES